MKYIKDGLFGLAVGEAFSVQLDMEERNLDSPVTTMQEFRAYDAPRGSYSDDTCELLASFNAFLNRKNKDYKTDIYEEIMESLCSWVNNNEFSSTDYLFDISKTMRLALMNYWNTKDYSLCGLSEEKRQDASFLARVFFLTIEYRNASMSDNGWVDVIRKMTYLTHRSETSLLGGFIYFKLINYILNGNDFKSTLTILKRYQFEKLFNKETIDKYSVILKDDIKNLNINDIKDDDYIVSILESIVFVLSNTNNYRDAIIASNMIGGANGVRGSYIGLLAGLMYGYKGIPKEWVSVLKRKDYLDKWVRKIRASL